jgi:hypothetical protein
MSTADKAVGGSEIGEIKETISTLQGIVKDLAARVQALEDRKQAKHTDGAGEQENEQDVTLRTETSILSNKRPALELEDEGRAKRSRS